jgi:SAM-dependent methyltransferase
VAIIVPDVENYIVEHAKGISTHVKDQDIPQAFRKSYFRAKREIEEHHIEEDLEAQRVIALYLMNHELKTNDASAWWKNCDPILQDLIQKYWNKGPLDVIAEWILASSHAHADEIIELGCGVGGLARRLKGQIHSYLGVDSSFSSIVLARHLSLGTPYFKTLKIPQDLIQGPLTLSIHLPNPKTAPSHTDFIVGDLESLPVKGSRFHYSIAANTIDMLHQPEKLPKIQKNLLRTNGKAIQSCPYIWHEVIARQLREIIPKESTRDSATAVSWLYKNAGLNIEREVRNHPWLFFKHLRQLEVYSVHIIETRFLSELRRIKNFPSNRLGFRGKLPKVSFERFLDLHRSHFGASLNPGMK